MNQNAYSKTGCNCICSTSIFYEYSFDYAFTNSCFSWGKIVLELCAGSAWEKPSSIIFCNTFLRSFRKVISVTANNLNKINFTFPWWKCNHFRTWQAFTGLDRRLTAKGWKNAIVSWVVSDGRVRTTSIHRRESFLPPCWIPLSLVIILFLEWVGRMEKGFVSPFGPFEYLWYRIRHYRKGRSGR